MIFLGIFTNISKQFIEAEEATIIVSIIIDTLNIIIEIFIKKSESEAL